MKQIQAKPRQTIPLGHRGENEARQIIFDLTEYIDTYGPGTARLLHQRDGDPAPYIVPAVQSDTTMIWAVTDADTAAPGTGSAELQWTVNNVLAKSDIWRTKTMVALDDGATAPPTGAEGWYQQLIAYIDSLRDEGVSEEQIAAAVEAYLADNPVDVPVTSVNGKIGAVQLTAEDVGALAQDELQTGVDAALEQAKASGEFDGAPGDPGTDGITPTIGDNGNWYLGDTDTGKPSRGETGPAGADGADGAPGADGKTAYQYAQDGGYTGTEAEFAEKLAQEQLTGTTNDLTPTQVYDAVSAGIPVKVQYTDSTYGLISFTAFNVAESMNVIASQSIVYYYGVYILAELIGDKSGDTWAAMFATLAQKTDIPSALPNPNALTFTGAVAGTYDGSAPLSVEIPSGGSGSNAVELVYKHICAGTYVSVTDDLPLENGKVYLTRLTLPIGSVKLTIRCLIGSQGNTYTGAVAATVVDQHAVVKKQAHSLMMKTATEIVGISYFGGNVPDSTGYNLGQSKSSKLGDKIYLYSTSSGINLPDGTTVEVYRMN